MPFPRARPRFCFFDAFLPAVHRVRPFLVRLQRRFSRQIRTRRAAGPRPDGVPMASPVFWSFWASRPSA